jgi:hypothetical protein
MARTIDNAYLLSQWLKKRFGGAEFTEEQFFAEVEDFLGLGDSRSHQHYLEFCLKYEQVRRLESGLFVATPHKPLSLKMRLAQKDAEQC